MLRGREPPATRAGSAISTAGIKDRLPPLPRLLEQIGQSIVAANGCNWTAGDFV
jgi:hypothetical protein